MEQVNFQQLNKHEKKLLDLAKKTAEKSVSFDKHKIGSAICDAGGRIFIGATISKKRIIGSTCAERMALDNLLFCGLRKPKLIVIVGKMHGRKEMHLCTPCGRCREMFQEVCQWGKIKDINFLISNWTKKMIIRTKLSELLPLAFLSENSDNI